ncbi:hypothetical protein L228DRAFT_268536 [Xylona heveae TC161]|uniref:HMG box domain-containing protein n=1 Tax=Xylona heveae (strain CBS 132557 / TC161) TaxID=1328760 RepID=A0A165GCT2_XYLHT|nr:hypothetical protein L228DRAFT_268536 [Xylona heveae TC161]KZF22037.1 hypothetical protein L228DRAFT_268536 [Xylona heveae TC161]
MARPKKTEEKPKEAATLQISIEDFIRTRDSVVTGLATLQSAVQDLSRAYINHSNTVLGRPGAGPTLDFLSLSNPLGDNGLLLAQRGLTPGMVADAGEKKKRKKRAHDKNAPKRPLTPYFLYMQFARQDIMKALGEGARPKDISAEGTKRWAEMSDQDKLKWKEYYQENLAKYQEKMKEYKAKTGGADHSEDAAAQLAAEQEAVASAGSNDEEEEEEEQEEEPAPPKPASPVNKRRKTAASAAAASSPAQPSPAKSAPILPPSAKKEAAPEIKSPEPKKRRSRKSKGAEEAAAETAAPAKEPPKKEKAPRKKRKSEAVNE